MGLFIRRHHATYLGNQAYFEKEKINEHYPSSGRKHSKGVYTELINDKTLALTAIVFN